LYRQRRPHGVRRRGESDAKRIPDRLEDAATVRHKGLADEDIVTGEGTAHGLRVLFPKLRASLDVGE